MAKKTNKEAQKKNAAPIEEIQEQQYTVDEMANKVIETMFTAFAKITSHGIAAEVRG